MRTVGTGGSRNNLALPAWAASGRAVVAVGLVLLLAAFVADSARLYLFPPSGAAAHADAVVVLDGSDWRGRRQEGVDLVRDGVAPVIAVSANYAGDLIGRHCAPGAPAAVTVICFKPDPSTTQGEARELGRLAREYGWRSVVVVSATIQESRARLRVRRCFSGRISMVGVGTPIRDLPYGLAYEWAATLKALTLQRAC